MIFVHDKWVAIAISTYVCQWSVESKLYRADFEVSDLKGTPVL